MILTSSSQAKLDRAVDLLKPLVRTPNANVLQTIDYSKIDDWDKEARRLNGDKGVDFVIEVAGRGTIGRSIRSTKMGGLVAVSGERFRLKRGHQFRGNRRALLSMPGSLIAGMIAEGGRDFTRD